MHKNHPAPRWGGEAPIPLPALSGVGISSDHLLLREPVLGGHRCGRVIPRARGRGSSATVREPPAVAWAAAPARSRGRAATTSHGDPAGWGASGRVGCHLAPGGDPVGLGRMLAGQFPDRRRWSSSRPDQRAGEPPPRGAVGVGRADYLPPASHRAWCMGSPVRTTRTGHPSHGWQYQGPDPSGCTTDRGARRWADSPQIPTPESERGLGVRALQPSAA